MTGNINNPENKESKLMVKLKTFLQSSPDFFKKDETYWKQEASQELKELFEDMSKHFSTSDAFKQELFKSEGLKNDKENIEKFFNYRRKIKFDNLNTETLDTEKTYQNSLNLLKDNKEAILKVFKKSEGKFLMEDLFHEIDTILKLSDVTDPFSNIRESQKEKNESYAKYMNLYSKCSEIYGKMTKKQKDALLNIVTNNNNKLDFPSLIITPVQRVPRYVMLLKDILQNASDSDKKTYEEKNEVFSNMATYLNEEKRKSERKEAILNIQELLSSTFPNKEKIASLVKEFKSSFEDTNKPFVFDFATSSKNTNNQQLRIMFALYENLSPEAKKNVSITLAVYDAVRAYKDKKYTLADGRLGRSKRDSYFKKDDKDSNLLGDEFLKIYTQQKEEKVAAKTAQAAPATNPPNPPKPQPKPQPKPPKQSKAAYEAEKASKPEPAAAKPNRPLPKTPPQKLKAAAAAATAVPASSPEMLKLHAHMAAEVAKAAVEKRERKRSNPPPAPNPKINKSGGS